MSGLREAVTARHGSIHAFCRLHPELNRSTVYQVLTGRYAGNMDRQLSIIRAALDQSNGRQHPAALTVPDVAALADVLQTAKCGTCRRKDRRWCRGCAKQTAREAQALRQYLEQQR